MAMPKLNVAHKAAVTVNKVESKINSRPVLIALILITSFVFSSLLVFNYLAAKPDLSGGLFTYGQSEISEMYPVRITPAGWAFSIWGVIYFLMISWVIYNLALLCRDAPDGMPAYLSPTVLSPGFLIFFNLSSVFNIGWLFLFDRLLFVAAFIFLACIAISLYLAWAIIGQRIVIYRNFLIDQGRMLEVRFITVAVVNGLAMYATWTTIATLINLNMVIIYKFDQIVSYETAAIICLGILAAVIIIYVFLDLSVLDRYSRYTIAPYLVVVWASAAIISKNWNPENMSSIMCAVILGATSLATLSKITLTFARCRYEMYQYRQMKSEN